jgi:alanyl-tRNA synthetase
MSIEIKTHTALHVLKGAVVKVLDAKWTAGVSVNGNHGRLTVQYDKKPTEEEISRIEKETNDKIEENVTIEIHEMDRADAESRWGDLIYDLFHIPPSITRLSIFHLPGWNVNACNKQHTESTGEIGVLKITKVRYRASKKLLEISFDLV